MHEGEVVARQLFEAHRDPTRAFDALEEVLYQAPLLVDVLVDLSLRRARRIRWNHDHAATRPEVLHQRLRVVGHVAGHVRVTDAREQLVRHLHLVRLPWSEQQAHGISQRVDHGVDLRGRTSARAPDFLVPPLLPRPTRPDGHARSWRRPSNPHRRGPATTLRPWPR